MRLNKYTGVLAFAVVLVAGCGGGGGGASSAGGGGVPPTSAPTATPTATPAPITGAVVDFASGAPLAGFTVTIGALPVACSGFAGCGQPLAPTFTGTTSSTGSFSLTAIPAGSYMMQIAKDATYATLHVKVNITAGASLGTWKITGLSSDEQSWVADVNSQRVNVSFPATPGNLVVDEYAEEQARNWANDIASGKTAYGDAGFLTYSVGYIVSPGRMYSTVSGVLTAGFPARAYAQADMQWMGEKANCAGGNWQTCVYASNTGHYINISNALDIWLGVGQSTSAIGAGLTGTGTFAYDVFFVQP